MIDVRPGEIYTIANGDQIRFIPSEEDTATLIINGRIYKIYYDTTDDVMSFVVPTGNTTDFSAMGDSEDFLDEAIPQIRFNIEINNIEASPVKYTFTATFYLLDCPLQGNKSRYLMPNDFVDELVARLDAQKAKAVKFWEEYTEDFVEWKFLLDIAWQGLICYEDLPDEPKLEDYI